MPTDEARALIHELQTTREALVLAQQALEQSAQRAVQAAEEALAAKAAALSRDVEAHIHAAREEAVQALHSARNEVLEAVRQAVHEAESRLGTTIQREVSEGIHALQDRAAAVQDAFDGHARALQRDVTDAMDLAGRTGMAELDRRLGEAQRQLTDDVAQAEARAGETLRSTIDRIEASTTQAENALKNFSETVRSNVEGWARETASTLEHKVNSVIETGIQHLASKMGNVESVLQNAGSHQSRLESAIDHAAYFIQSITGLPIGNAVDQGTNWAFGHK